MNDIIVLIVAGALLLLFFWFLIKSANKYAKEKGFSNK